MSKQLRKLGPHFSEGARQLWLAWRSHGGSMRKFAGCLALSPSTLHKLLYGRARPGLACAFMIASYAPVVGPHLWLVAPRAAFALPKLGDWT